ncbi:hypothetical protein [Rhodococcus corynebacterioides]|uniref:hypothetical protein n=1 Tax=Rhodococcoides corynebacterioides TaxID=53972 RepID=UPI000830553F
MRSTRHCNRCTQLHNTINAARRYIETHGLRPLGASLTSDSEDERAARVGAAAARRKLDSVKTQRKNGKSAVRNTPAVQSKKVVTPTKRSLARQSRKRDGLIKLPPTEKLVRLRRRIQEIDRVLHTLNSGSIPDRRTMSELGKERTRIKRLIDELLT